MSGKATNSPDPAGSIDMHRAGDGHVARLSGAWTTEALPSLDVALRRLAETDTASLRLDLSGIEHLDTNGAWAISRTANHLGKRGVRVEIVGARPSQSSLLDVVARTEVPPVRERETGNALLALAERVGRATVAVLRETRDVVNFLGLTVVTLLATLLHPRRLRITALVAQMERTGLDALPIIGLISFLIGVVLAYQGAIQLQRFGAEIFTVDLVGAGVLREMGILLTAIMVAGRSGSAFAAQLGTMQLNEEIDALRTIGLDPIEVLVLPRVLALVVIMPLLAFYADMMGLLGGAVMATLALDISFVQFTRQLNGAVSMWSFWIGIIKAPLFAFFIGLIGCFRGLRPIRDAAAVGRATTSAVVESVFLVIVLDAVFSIVFSILGV